ncbi:hypothetical protein C8R46DRAFT_448088 [Mycena filopes]|nr:hypothetical protein C8R46DRAFT_448088 [Mycena filopes]
MSSSSLSTRVPRQAAKKASTKFEAQLMSSPAKADEKAKPAKRARSRPNLKKAASSPPKRSAGLSKNASTRPRPRKRPISLDSRRSDDEESDLTSLSTRTASPVLKSRSRPTVSARPLSPDSDDDYVWVLLDPDSGEAYSLADEDDGVRRTWWPARRLRSEGGECRVRLFGEPKELSIDTPHDGNIIPFVDDKAIRFRDPVYSTSSPKSIAASPRKRQRLDKLDKTDVEQKWRAAQLEAIHDYEKSEEFPDMRFLASVVGIPGYDAPSNLSDDDASSELSEVVSSERWSPPPADSSVEVPGELVLACETDNKPSKVKVYWPARIENFVPGLGPNKPGMYGITWMDSSTGVIPRSAFYTYEEEGFGTCVVGKFESSFQEVVKDLDVDERPRGPSPEPRDPPPGPAAFCDLSVREQFVYAKPVLQAILRDEYGPARALHARYMAGGTERKKVAEEAPKRGRMDPRDVEEFQRCLTAWCLRDLRETAVEEEEEEGDGVVQEPTSNEGAGANEPDVSSTLHVPDSALPEKLDVQMQDVQEADPAAQTLCNPPSPTPTVRDSSPGLPPPSSSFSSSVDPNMEVEESEPPSSEETAPPTPYVADSDPDRAENALAPTPDVDLPMESILTDASDDSTPVSGAPPRQIGCAAYEELPTIKKLEYCLNVLLPELLVQINVWRLGHRTSVALLSGPNEAALHVIGAEEKETRDWVFDVKRLRAQKEGELAKEETVVGGTASRPKKARKR